MADYPDNYVDTLEKAVAEGYSYKFMRMLCGPDGVPLALGAGGGIPMEIVGTTGDVTLTGDVIVDTLGALNDAAVVNPAAASATVPALLRGNLTQTLAIKASVAALGALTDDAVVDPEVASASVPALLRGLLTQELAMLTKLSDDPATETTLALIESYTSRLLSSTTNVTPDTSLATTSLMVGARYNETPPTFTDGEEGGVQIDAAGRVLVKTDLLASVGAVDDVAWSGIGDATVISLLKAIALNTTPAP